MNMGKIAKVMSILKKVKIKLLSMKYLNLRSFWMIKIVFKGIVTIWIKFLFVVQINGFNIATNFGLKTVKPRVSSFLFTIVWKLTRWLEIKKTLRKKLSKNSPIMNNQILILQMIWIKINKSYYMIKK